MAVISTVTFGIYVPQLAMSPDDLVERALDCERLGFHALWLFDHLYGPGFPDADAYEAWTLASVLLAKTTTLRVGHLVSCNNFRHPAVLAKMATSLDVLSGGRVEFGIGSGSYEAEHHQAGLAWGTTAERSERLGEALEIITRMFASPRTSFAGKHYTVDDLPNLPAAVQQPRPPIHIGGAGPKLTLPLVARYADVWNVPTYALDKLDELSAVLDAECERIGRDPAEITRSVEAVLVTAAADGLDAAIEVGRRRFGGPGFGLDDGGFIGTPDAIVDRVGQLVDRGFSSFVFMTHDRASTDTLQLVAGEVVGHFRS
ncbi:MAG TPA: LLM class flavin-dependent oxidoreductase [Mycobacteriales bacterium]|nr:LLM class flavin-dependent oxidoreductase [Mycobacteriales bacterium]HWB68129.1 LLM class flavin-dependent oxidoreductase [Mycobacteriales bacterium]